MDSQQKPVGPGLEINPEKMGGVEMPVNGARLVIVNWDNRTQSITGEQLVIVNWDNSIVI